MKRQYKRKADPQASKPSGSKKRQLTVNSESRQIELSTDNFHSFIETGLKSMKLINDSDIVYSVMNSGPHFTVYLKKEV